MKFILATGLVALALSQATYAYSVGLNEVGEDAATREEINFGGIAGRLGKRVALGVGSGLGHILDGSGIGGNFGGRGRGRFEGGLGHGFGGGVSGNFRGRGVGNFRDIAGGEIKGGGKGSGGLGFGKNYRGGIQVEQPEMGINHDDYTEGLEWGDGYAGGRGLGARGPGANGAGRPPVAIVDGGDSYGAATEPEY